MLELRISKKAIFALAAAAGLAVIVVVVALANSGGGKPATQNENAFSAGHPGAPPKKMRTVLVSTGHEPPPSRAGTLLNALRLSGHLPSRPAMGTVLTDGSCAPDAHGVSHCINKIRLAGGRVLVVRHPHRMMEVPCLEPGEHVMVRPA